MTGPIHAIDQQNVLPPVAVVIEKRAARAQRLGKKFPAVRAGVVPEVNPRRRGYVGKLKSQRRRRRTPNHRRTHHRRPSHRACPSQKRPAVHGMFTSPLRMAYTTSSAVL